MALLVKDRIKETTTTTGTGTLTLAGAATGYQAFSVIGNASTTYYAIEDANGTGWEVGLGTYTLSGTTLARTTILASSNSGAAITLTSGTHDVFVTYPAGKAGFNDQGIAKTFTASGTVTTGKPVILEADGDAAQFVETTTGSTVTESIGAVQYYDAGSESYYNRRTNSCTLTGAYFLNIYEEGTNQYPSARIGEVGTDKTITWGTEVVLKSTAQRYQYKAAAYDADAGRIGIFVSDYTAGTDPYKFYGATATFSGTTLTVNTFTDIGDIDSASPTPVYAAYDPDNTTIVAICEGDTTFNTVTAFQVDVTGSTPSVDHQTSFAANFRSDEQQDKFVYDTYVDRFIYIYEDEDDNDQLKSRVLQNSGSAFTWGSANDISADNPEGYYGLAFDSTNNKLVTIYASDDTLTYSYSVGTVTGGGTNTTSWTSPVVINTAKNRYNPVALFYHPNAKKFLTVLSELGATSDNQKLYTATLSGSTLTIGGTSYTIEDFAVNSSINDIRIAGVFDSVVNDPVTINFGGASHANPYYRLDSYVFNTGQSPVITTNVTATNYLGVASTTATNGNPVDVNIPGSINNDQSGLTIGSQYYSTDAGVVGTGGSVFLGTAVSATALQLEQEPGSILLGTSDDAITLGKPVIVEADGDFSGIKDVPTTTENSGSAFTGTQTDISAFDRDLFNMAFNGDGTAVGFLYQDTSGGTSFQVGTFTGTGASTTISWGTAVQLNSSSGQSAKMALAWHTKAECWVTGYPEGTSATKGSTITHSGSTATIGIEFTINASDYPDSAKSCMVYIADAGDDGLGRIIYLSNFSSAETKAYGYNIQVDSASSVTVNTQDEGPTVDPQYGAACDIGANRGLYYFKDSDGSNYPKVLIFTVGNTTIDWGTPVTINSASSGYCAPAFNPTYTGKAIIAGHLISSGSDFDYVSATFGTASGDRTITLGSLADVDTGNCYVETGGNTFGFSSYNGNYVAVFGDADDGYKSTYRLGTTSDGVSITWGSRIQPTHSPVANQYYAGIATSTSTGKMVEFHSNGNNYYRYYVLQPTFTDYPSTQTATNLTTENYIGIARDTVADATALSVTTIGGINTQQSGLTAGQLYYVQTDGTISTSAGTPSVIAGTALSATELLVSRS